MAGKSLHGNSLQCMVSHFSASSCSIYPMQLHTGLLPQLGPTIAYYSGYIVNMNNSRSSLCLGAPILSPSTPLPAISKLSMHSINGHLVLYCSFLPKGQSGSWCNSSNARKGLAYHNGVRAIQHAWSDIVRSHNIIMLAQQDWYCTIRINIAHSQVGCSLSHVIMYIFNHQLIRQSLQCLSWSYIHVHEYLYNYTFGRGWVFMPMWNYDIMTDGHNS